MRVWKNISISPTRVAAEIPRNRPKLPPTSLINREKGYSATSYRVNSIESICTKIDAIFMLAVLMKLKLFLISDKASKLLLSKNKRIFGQRDKG